MAMELKAEQITCGYDDQIIIEDMDLTIPEHKISVIIGANGCGKSTLLKAFCRLIKPVQGAVLLDGKKLQDWSNKKLAQKLGLMPQSPHVPEGISVAELVARGRFPHRHPFKSMNHHDYEAIAEAMHIMKIEDLAERNVEELSGGQRQRVWIALALAQDSDILFLDEPTTYLDIAYQVEILDMLKDLNMRKQTTIVMVLHDVNLSARYGDHLFALADGKLIAQGAPNNIVNETLIKTIYHLDCQILTDPLSNSPMVLPIGKYHRP